MIKKLTPLQSCITAVAVCSVFLTLTAQAEIYKQVQPDGSVIFTDQPKEGVVNEEVDIKPTATIPAIDPSTVNVQPPEAKPQEIDFRININSPITGKTFRNGEADAIPLLVGIIPKATSKYKVRITLDGQEIPLNTTVLPPQSRGEHSIKVQITKGDKTISEASSTFFVHRFSAQH